MTYDQIALTILLLAVLFVGYCVIRYPKAWNDASNDYLEPTSWYSEGSRPR